MSASIQDRFLFSVLECKPIVLFLLSFILGFLCVNAWINGITVMNIKLPIFFDVNNTTHYMVHIWRQYKSKTMVQSYWQCLTRCIAHLHKCLGCKKPISFDWYVRAIGLHYIWCELLFYRFFMEYNNTNEQIIIFISNEKNEQQWSELLKEHK